MKLKNLIAVYNFLNNHNLKVWHRHVTDGYKIRSDLLYVKSLQPKIQVTYI